MVVRRYVFPVLWLVVFAVIAAALFKLAFIDGFKADAAGGGEHASAQLSTPLVPAVLGTVTNLVQVQGSVVSDPAVAVKSTSDGTVDFIYVQAGDDVIAGAPLFQVKTLVEPEAPAVPEDPSGPDDAEPGSAERSAVSPPAQAYAYADVLATADGTVAELSVLPKQQVSVGAEVASLDPGTFSVSGTLTPDQQFRILGRANTAMVTVNGGPAPFPCSDVTMGKTPAAETGIGTQAQMAGPGQPAAPQAPAAGSVSCSIPKDVPVFSGLGASIDITAGQAEGVVTVPTTAVQGTVQTGIVWVMPGGAAPGNGAAEGAAAAGPGVEGSGAEGAGPEGMADSAEAVEREVSLGLNDGQLVEITSGLVEGEMVLQFVPGAPADEVQMNGMPGVMGG